MIRSQPNPEFQKTKYTRDCHKHNSINKCLLYCYWRIYRLSEMDNYRDRLSASLLDHFDCRDNAVDIENILKKGRTCCLSLAKLVTMHQNEHNSRREFASCSLKLSDHEEDRMSWCQNGKSGFEKRRSVSSNDIPKMLKESKSRENRRLRCKWQLTRHFSRDTLASEFAAGDLELPRYISSICLSHLEEKNERDLFLLSENPSDSILALRIN